MRFKTYTAALNLDPTSHSALTALGYLSREISDAATAEKYFLKLRNCIPTIMFPYLALGDLYTSARDFPSRRKTTRSHMRWRQIMRLIVVGGANSALESQDLPLTKKWLDRADASPGMNDVPQVMRERERYLTRTGKYEESAEPRISRCWKNCRTILRPPFISPTTCSYLNRYDEAYNMAVKYEHTLAEGQGSATD